jgi:hypothetical protein
MPTQLTSIRLGWLPLKLADAVARLASRLAFGNLARYGLARPALGPLTAFKMRRRVPLIDVGTIAAVKRGDIAIKPAVATLHRDGRAVRRRQRREFDAVVLATGYRPALEDIVAVPGVLDDEGYPRDWKGGAHPGLFFVGYYQPPTGLLAVRFRVPGLRPVAAADRASA